VSLIEQVEKGGVRRPSLEIQAQRLVEHLPMPPSERLEITGAAAAAQDPQDRNQQQEPLWIAHPTAVATIWDNPEDHIMGISLIDCSI